MHMDNMENLPTLDPNTPFNKTIQFNTRHREEEIKNLHQLYKEIKKNHYQIDRNRDIKDKPPIHTSRKNY